MLCSNCYREIPEGKKIEKSFQIPWRGIWGSYCKKCAAKLDKEQWFFWRGIFLLFFISAIVIWIRGGK